MRHERALENQELVEILKAAGFADVVDALFETDSYKKNGKLNLSALARKLGVYPQTMEKRLLAMQELLEKVTE